MATLERDFVSVEGRRQPRRFVRFVLHSPRHLNLRCTRHALVGVPFPLRRWVDIEFPIERRCRQLVELETGAYISHSVMPPRQDFHHQLTFSRRRNDCTKNHLGVPADRAGLSAVRTLIFTNGSSPRVRHCRLRIPLRCDVVRPFSCTGPDKFFCLQYVSNLVIHATIPLFPRVEPCVHRIHRKIARRSVAPRGTN